MYPQKELAFPLQTLEQEKIFIVMENAKKQHWKKFQIRKYLFICNSDSCKNSDSCMSFKRLFYYLEKILLVRNLSMGKKN